MTDYKKMYAIVCAAASEALDHLADLPENAAAKRILQEALFAAEEVYLSDETESEIHKSISDS